jgi:ribonuclease J
MVGHSDDIFKEISALSAGLNADKRLKLTPDDIFINVAVPRPIFETIATRSMDNVYRTGCDVVWLKNKAVHSMHAQEDDLRFVLNIFKPKYYFPVRGHYTKIMENAKLAVSLGIGLNHMNVFVLDNGMQLIFEENKRPVILPYEVTGLDTSPVLVDGKGLTKDSDEVVTMRQKLGVDGTVIIASTVSLSEKKIIAGPDCQMRGFVYVKEAEPLLKSITQIYVEEVNAALQRGLDLEETKNTIKDRARWFIRRENGREPLIEPIIIIEK